MSRKDPYFSFKDRDSVEYKPQYGTAYTPRQEKILSGELPLEDIRPNELSLLKQKAKHLGDMEGYEIATLRYPALLETIEHHITEYGVAEFVVGQYGNFDRLVIRALSQAKRAHPDITLMLMTPYYPVNRKVDLPEAFDALFYPPDLEAVPKRLAIIRANRYMVERSDFLIAYVRHPASNAKELLEYAGTGKRKGKIHITNLAEEQIPLPKKTDDVI